MLLDLTQILMPGIPDWDGCCGFSIRQESDDNAVVCVQSLKMSSGIGTHIDAPCHFVKKGRDVASIHLDQLVVQAVVVDVRKDNMRDYLIQYEDILQFEKQHRVDFKDTLVFALTGWSQYWHDAKQYRAFDSSGNSHFPTFSLSAVDYLLTKGVVGIGIDTLSPDASHSDFSVHRNVLGADKYIIENVCNLDQMPPVGATVMALPLKISSGSEASCRVVAKI